MIRTIDGTDYLPKSEVLRIIDEEISDSRDTRSYPNMCDHQRHDYLCRECTLQVLRDRLTSLEDR